MSKIFNIDEHRRRRTVLRVLDQTMDATALVAWAEQAETQILASLDRLRAGKALLIGLNARLDEYPVPPTSGGTVVPFDRA